MVKKIIEGILKKKDKDSSKEKDGSEKPADDSEDVPDELPPLAEGLVDKEEKPEAKEDAAPKTPSEETKSDSDNLPKEEIPEEMPDELPSLDDGPSEDSPADDKKQEEKEGKAGDAKESDKTPEKDLGFFSNILSHFKKHDESKSRLLDGDLFSRMTNYWELKKDEIRSGDKLSSQAKLEGDLTKNLSELRELEKKWHVQKLALEEDLKYLHEREMEIQLKIQELQRISNELNLFHNVKPEQYFNLYNGVVLKNLHDLIDALEIMDDDTFKHHVGKEKNDFANWIRHVIKDKNIASKIFKSKDRDEMIEVLETEPVILENKKSRYKKELPPKKYFWLANGIVIKSLLDLNEALKTMNDDLFSKHVNKDKNEISDWLTKKLKMTDLGKKVKKVKSRNEMINIFEVYL